jgi:hypothetical protein
MSPWDKRPFKLLQPGAISENSVFHCVFIILNSSMMCIYLPFDFIIRITLHLSFPTSQHHFSSSTPRHRTATTYLTSPTLTRRATCRPDVSLDFLLFKIYSLVSSSSTTHGAYDQLRLKLLLRTQRLPFFFGKHPPRLGTHQILELGILDLPNHHLDI